MTIALVPRCQYQVLANKPVINARTELGHVFFDFFPPWMISGEGDNDDSDDEEERDAELTLKAQ